MRQSARRKRGGRTASVHRVTMGVAAVAFAALAACSANDVVTEQTEGCTGPTPYQVGATVAGRTGAGDCVGVENSPGQLYSFTLSEPAAIAATAVFTGFRGYLAIARPDNRPIAQTNADEQGADLTVRAFVPAGSYRIFVASMDNRNGTFTLTSGPGEVDGCEAGRSSGVLPGAVVAGTIATTDCPGTSTRLDNYLLPLAAGERVTLTLTAARLSGFTAAPANGGAQVVNQVVQPNGTVTASFTSPVAQRYVITVIAYFSQQQPLVLPYAYTLRVE